MAENVLDAGAENQPPMLKKVVMIVRRVVSYFTLKLTYALFSIIKRKLETCGTGLRELIEGIELTKQEKESKLYDDFNIFTSEKGESIHSYYLRYAKLIIDMDIIGMNMISIQINTKFVNHL
nr:integrase, catalytic region, zinc finger, CCHC-type, peptidase aspartic, catalytic [Tanacetum cinerariifolium]